MSDFNSKEKRLFVYAYEPFIKRRVVYVIVNDYAISLLTKHKFKLTDKIKKELVKNE